MELHHLRSFREVARERSFTTAAKNLLLTQPAVSQQVKALEVELGERLFDRKGRDVKLTPAGDILLEAAERMFSAADDAARRIRETKTSEEGTVVIACGDTVALYLLPPVLTKFRKRFPKAEVTVRNHGSRRILELLLTEPIDLAVATAPPHLDPAFESAPLLEETLVLALPPDHALAKKGVATLAELEGESAVWLAKPSVTRSIIERGLKATNTRLATAMESGNLEVVKAYVARGFGLTILPAMAVTEDDRRRLAVHPLPAGFPKRKLVVLRRKDRFQTKLARELTTILAAETSALRSPKPRGT